MTTIFEFISENKFCHKNQPVIWTHNKKWGNSFATLRTEEGKQLRSDQGSRPVCWGHWQLFSLMHLHQKELHFPSTWESARRAMAHEKLHVGIPWCCIGCIQDWGMGTGGKTSSNRGAFFTAGILAEGAWRWRYTFSLRLAAPSSYSQRIRQKSYITRPDIYINCRWNMVKSHPLLQSRVSEWKAWMTCRPSAFKSKKQKSVQYTKNIIADLCCLCCLLSNALGCQLSLRMSGT